MVFKTNFQQSIDDGSICLAVSSVQDDHDKTIETVVETKETLPERSIIFV